MKKLWRIVRTLLLSLLLLVVSAAALFGYFVYSPEPAPLPAPGKLTKGTIEVGGLVRSYLSYVPRHVQPGAPLLFVMHGSGESAADARIGTGYGFERLAEEHGFVIVYPESLTFDWNDCSIVGDYRIKGAPVDDIGYLRALAGKAVRDTGASAARTFASGVSAGGSMALRLAIEAPDTFRAAAAVSASVPTADNFKCKSTAPAARVMIMNGTSDPLVPYGGGEINLWGMFYKAGTVLSSQASAQFLALAGQGGNGSAPAAPVATTLTTGGVKVDTLSYRTAAHEAVLVTIDGGGHGLPQAYYRRPRLLGPSPMAPDGPSIIWRFLQRSEK